MKCDFNEDNLVVSLSRVFIDALLKLHNAMDSELIGTLQDSLAENSKSQSKHKITESDKPLQPPHKKYKAKFIDTVVAGRTLPEVFANIVDMTAKDAPEALDKLARISARKRKYVALTKEAIHPDRKDLPTIQTKSGWWISRNIGKEDLKRALRALSEVTGKNINFPAV